MFQVCFTSKGMGGVYMPIDGRTIFASIEDAKTYMVSHAMYPIVWTETGCEPYPVTGNDDRETGFAYMIVRLSVFPGKVGD